MRNLICLQRSLGTQRNPIETSTFWDCLFTFFATVQWQTDLGATRHAPVFKFLNTVLSKTELESNISRALFVVLVYGPWRNKVPAYTS